MNTTHNRIEVKMSKNYDSIWSHTHLDRTILLLEDNCNKRNVLSINMLNSNYNQQLSCLFQLEEVKNLQKKDSEGWDKEKERLKSEVTDLKTGAKKMELELEKKKSQIDQLVGNKRKKLLG